MGHSDHPPHQDRLTHLSRLTRLGFGGLEWLPLAALVIDSDGTPLVSNAAWKALAATPGRPRGEGDWLAAVDPSEREPLRGRLRAAAAESGAEHVDVPVAGSDGRRWMRWWWSPGPGRRLVVCVADLAGPPDPAARQRAPRQQDPQRDDPPSDNRPPDDPPPEEESVQRPSAVVIMADMVVRRLHAVGMLLDSVAAAPAGDPAAIRLARATRDLDSIIRDVRSAAFRAHHAPPPRGDGPGQ